jgi:hypothetical protein
VDDDSRAATVASWIRRKRSPIGISPVGTSILASENAFAPELSVRVLIAMLARRWSTGWPISMW